MKENTREKHTGSRVIIIVLSFIFIINGLGLIVSGLQTNKKKWIRFGIFYIVMEIIFLLTGVVAITVILYIIAILHTLLIGNEYSQALLENDNHVKDKTISNSYSKKTVSNPTSSKKAVHDSSSGKAKASVVKKNVVTADKQESFHQINYQDIVLTIGSATVVGDNDNLTIQIIDENGKVYRFYSEGNNIVSFQLGSGKKNYYR